MDYPLNQSVWRRGWNDTKKVWTSWPVVLLDGAVCVVVGAVFTWYWGLGLFIFTLFLIWVGATASAPVKQRNKALTALNSIPGATPNSPRLASPQLFFEDIDCKFIGDNPPLLLIKWTVTPTGSMHLEQAKIEILGIPIPFTDWETCDVSPTVSFMFANHCEIKGKLPTGNHDIRIQVLANRIWWASDWQTITYSPSVPDKEGYRT